MNLIGWLLKLLTGGTRDPRTRTEKKKDYGFRDAEVNPIQRPDKRKWATFPPNVQGKMGSCWGQAGANAVETLINERTGQGGKRGIRLSPLFVYKLAEAVDQHDAQGTYGWAVMHALLKYGVCEEKYMPYHDDFQKMLEQPIHPDAYENAKQYRIKAYYKIDKSKAYDQIVEALSTPGMMVCLSLNIHSGWDRFQVKYDYPPTKWVWWYGGHAMACDGVIWFQNSWWLSGDGTGHVEITRAYLKKCFIEGYIIRV